MNKLYLLLVFLLSTFMDIQGQVVAVKTNVLYDAITTPMSDNSKTTLFFHE